MPAFESHGPERGSIVRLAVESQVRFLNQPVKPTSREKSADAAQISAAAHSGMAGGIDAQAPNAKMPKNGPAGLSFILSATSEPSPARSASIQTSPQA